MGKGIVELAHRILKKWLLKTKQWQLYPPPKVNKSTSCFCLVHFIFFAN
jgi:hypothetical protein